MGGLYFKKTSTYSIQNHSPLAAANSGKQQLESFGQLFQCKGGSQ
jgi:hypothetical protein